MWLIAHGTADPQAEVENQLVQIGMLGPFEVRTADGTLTDVPGARLRGLLVALALRPGHTVPKATLIDWIWGEHPPVDAANSLQRLVSRLRKLLPDGVVEGRTDGYRLTVDPDTVDATRFERLVERGRDAGNPLRLQLLREALALWRGAAMQDVGLRDSGALAAAVTRFEELRLVAVEDRFDAEIGLGHGAELVAELSDVVAAHPLRERLVAALMRALVAAGRDTDALLAYQRVREGLADALGADPSPELAALHVALLRGERGRPAERSRTNLRAELTSFVGREADIAVVRELVADYRLITLTGPGGAGKTRLATETARTLIGDLPDGAWLVELAAIGTGGDVAQAALAGLGLRDTLLGEAPNTDLTDRFVSAVRDRAALLILDNCEHVIESVAVFVDRVLGRCRRLRILATSREPLGITGEALWLVEPLAVPPEHAGPGESAGAPAVRLLRDRAGAVRNDLVVDDHAVSTMVRVCRALDGMPLAIELAAARLRTMSLDQLAQRLDDRFRLLTGGSRTALPRHKTLRAVVDWSWELLTDAERTVLRRLSVFSGGASPDAAERVCAGAGLAQAQVLELLDSLAEKSLLRTEGRGALRYRMLGTIQQYAALRLVEAGEADATRRRHLACFTDLVETAEPHLRRAEQLEWLATLGAEQDNITAALRGALAAGDAQAAMQLAAGTGWYWWLGGQKTTGMELLIAATETPGQVSDDVRAAVYALITMFVSSGRGDADQAATWIHEAYRLRLRSRSPHPLLGFVVPMEYMLRAPDAVLPAFEALLLDADPWVRALARLQLGKTRIMVGDGGRDADAHLETALAEFRAIGERFGISFALTELADRLATRGELADACEYYGQAIAAVTEIGALKDVVRMRARQAQLYWMLGDEAAGAAVMADAERIAARVTSADGLAELALAKAELARWRGDAAEAHRQLGVATTMLGDDAQRAGVRAITHDLQGYITGDPVDARAHHAAACDAAAEAGHAQVLAQVLVGVADLALRCGRPESAAQLLAASAGVSGLPDRSRPDTSRIERAAREQLGEARFTEVTRTATGQGWSELVELALAP